MSIQAQTSGSPTSVGQSVLSIDTTPYQVDAATQAEIAYWEAIFANASQPEEVVSNHVYPPLDGTVPHSRHDTIPDFNFHFRNISPQAVDQNINSHYMGASGPPTDASIFSGSSSNPPAAIGSPFELAASTCRPLSALADMSHFQATEVSSLMGHSGSSSQTPPGLGGSNQAPRGINGSHYGTTIQYCDLGPGAGHWNSSSLAIYRKREDEPPTRVYNQSSFPSANQHHVHSYIAGGAHAQDWGYYGPHSDDSMSNRSSEIRFDPMDRCDFRQRSAGAMINAVRTPWPGPEPSFHASGPDCVHPGNFNSPGVSSPALPHLQEIYPTLTQRIHPGDRYSSTSHLAYKEFASPVTSNCTDGRSSPSWTQPLSLDNQPIIHATGRNIFSSPDETQTDASLGSSEVSANTLVDGVFDTSAGQHNLPKNLGPSLEEELRPFGDSWRKYCQPGGRPSTEHLSTSQCPISLQPQPQATQALSSVLPSSAPPISSRSLSCFSPTRRKGAASGPLLPCHWGILYGKNGEEYRCSLSESMVRNGKVLQHWAWQHVANEVFAIRRKIIEMKDAKIVNTQGKLETAILHLGLCPNPECDAESPMIIWYNRSIMRKRHLKTHVNCEGFFEWRVSKKGKGKARKHERYGNAEMGKLLGFVSLVRPKASHVLKEGCQLVDGGLL
ncbi:hypothetical protein BU17DRAFT_101178 [Hysterangium stoloniferum]|nr:hypothetical protein BU17DRAFT_101178 [Hysterangium stoloniferum]